MFKIGDRLIRTAIRPESLYGIGSIVEVTNVEPSSAIDPYNRPYYLTVRVLKPTTSKYGRTIKAGKTSFTDPREYKLYQPISKTKALHATNI